MLTPYEQHQLDYCIQNCGDDTYFLSQFLDDIEPQDKAAICKGLLELFAKVNSQYVQYVFDRMTESEPVQTKYDYEEFLHECRRAAELRAYERGYAV